MTVHQIFTQFTSNLWMYWLDSAPWLLLGLVLAGLVKAWMPPALLNRWLGGQGFWPIVKGAVIGTPLPLCSCSVLPAAMALRRSGASKGAMVSFLIATPENGLDSAAISYALLGPFMTIVRPVAAITSAIFAGFLTQIAAGVASPEEAQKTTQDQTCVKSCCATRKEATSPGSPWRRSLEGVKYAFTDMFDDIAAWLAVGLVLAAIVGTFVPPDALVRWGSGLPAMLGMLVLGVPMYVCATTSTPLAASLLLAGTSPGTVLVFLLTGPATNISTLGIVRKELGWRALSTYVAGISVGAIAFGLLTDAIVAWMHLNIKVEAAHAAELMPGGFALTAAIGLIAFGLLRLGRSLQRGWMRRRQPKPTIGWSGT